MRKFTLRKTLRKHPTLNTTENSIIDETMNTFEWQANAFAANLAAPIPFINVLSVLNYGMNRPFIYNGPSEYCLTYNNQTEWIFIRTKNDLARAIARKIQHFFDGLSIETLSYQIEKGLIHEPFRSYNQLITIPETSIIGDLMMDIYS